ncbi:outer dynein arm-docking complex subunit 3 isoform X2 [Amia ocellicauda]|uniref:outer dynein arm-docking complex subunit 3 isoform X2 n=1 Tax=Amia ocellicauda TaxID=2972642 RepID=UPI00346388FD
MQRDQRTAEQIAELRRRIRIIERESSAYYEDTQRTIQKNKETILQLRQQNEKLQKKLADSLARDERVVKDAFQDNRVEGAAMRNKTGMAAVQIVEQKTCDTMKKLNALRHQKKIRQCYLKKLQAQYSQMQQESSEPEPTAEEAKAESLTHQTQLDGLEAEILRQRQELKKLEVINRDACLSRDAAKAELQRQEEMLNRESREREKILAEYRKQVDEIKQQRGGGQVAKTSQKF